MVKLIWEGTPEIRIMWQSLSEVAVSLWVEFIEWHNNNLTQTVLCILVLIEQYELKLYTSTLNIKGLGEGQKHILIQYYLLFEPVTFQIDELGEVRVRHAPAVRAKNNPAMAENPFNRGTGGWNTKNQAGQLS